MASGKDKFYSMLGKSMAIIWVGSDPSAKSLTDVCTNIFTSIISRVDLITNGAGSKCWMLLYNENLKKFPGADAIKTGIISKEEWAIRQIAVILFQFIPPEYQSLENLLSKFKAYQTAEKNTTSNAESTPGGAPENNAELSKFNDLFIPSNKLAAVWPNRDTLAKRIMEGIEKLRKLSCLGSVTDLIAWSENVPLRTACNYAVAEAIQVAFQGLNLTGITKSNMTLGNQVHKKIATAAGRALALRQDVYLVADNDVYSPGRAFSPRNIQFQADDDALRKEYSLKVLIQARNKLDNVIRSRNSATSREDLVVFFNNNYLGLSSIIPGILDVARPELYEVKAIDSLFDAVSQVTSYSWNYLVASIQYQCEILPAMPLSRLDNPLMLFASPESHTIAIPTLTLTDLAVINSFGPLQLPLMAQKLAELVQLFLSQSFSSPPFLAVPFMISGLYGIIPYFVIDLGKLAKTVQDVLTAILNALIAAMIAYMAAKKNDGGNFRAGP